MFKAINIMSLNTVTVPKRRANVIRISTVESLIMGT